MRIDGEPAKSPISECEQSAAWLGRALRVDYISRGVTRAIEWSRPLPHLVWLEDSRALLISADKGHRVGPGASRTFEDWHQRAPKSEFALELRSATWVKLGRVLMVDYWSNKWGKAVEYTHDVGNGTSLYAGSNGVLVVKGKIRVSSRGLIG